MNDNGAPQSEALIPIPILDELPAYAIRIEIRDRLSRSCEVNFAGIAERKAVNLSAHIASLLRRFFERVHEFNDGRLTFAADDKINRWMLSQNLIGMISRINTTVDGHDLRAGEP